MSTFHELISQRKLFEEKLEEIAGEISTLEEIELNENVLQLREKVDGYGRLLEEFENEENRLKELSDHYGKKAKTMSSAITRLKFLAKTGTIAVGENIDGDVYRFKAWQCDKKLVIDNENLIPDEYTEQVVTRKLNKVDIKKALKKELDIPGARLETNYSFKIERK